MRTPSGGSDADISGATSRTYSLNTLDVGATLKVRVTVTDDEGHQATFTSAPTSAVVAAAPTLPEVSVMHGGSPITEGGVATFTFTLSKTIGDISLRVNIRRTETGNMMFPNNLGNSVVVFGPNQTTLTVSYPTVDDDTTEPNSTVTVEVLERNYYMPGTPSMASVEVRDDDDSPATGSVTVTGTPTEGQTLTADTSGLTDEDGLDNASYVYQWVRTLAGGSDADISGATSQTYVPVYADAGATLKVRVTVTDDEGHEATFTSAATSAVAALPRPSVTVVSDGDVTEGSAAVFTLTRTGDLAQTLDVAYETTATGDFGVTPGAGTATFPANSATVQVSVATTVDDTHETHGSVKLTLTADTAADPAWVLGDPSTATAAVEDDDDSPATGSVTITTATTFTEGETLTADTSGLADEDGLDAAGYVYQWVRTPDGGSDTDIPGATSQTYVPVFADAGATLKVKVTVTDDEGHDASFTSAPTSTIAAAPLPEVSVMHGGSPITEGGVATFTFTLSKTIGDISLRVNIRRTETGNMMFPNNLGNSVVVFGPNQTTLTVSYPTVDDDTAEPNSTVTVEVLERNYYMPGTPSMASVEVRDDDDSPATGSVTVTGTATEGQTLTADTSGLTDADGLDNAAYTYQWVRTPAGGSDADISGATSETYVPVFADAAATLKVRVTVTDDEGHEATFTSAPTSAVAALPRPSVTVVSAGDVMEGSATVFTLTRTGDLAQTLDVAYETTATGDFGVTTGAGTATFLANSATVQVSLTTTGDDTHEAHGSVTVTLTADTGADPAYLLGDPATATATVRDDDNVAPTGAPTIDDTTPVVGQTLTADPSGIGDVDGLTGATFTWRWLRVASGGTETPITGATTASYTVVAGDVGSTLKVEASFTDDGGTAETVESAATSAVEAAPRPRVSVARVSSPVAEGEDAQFRVTRTGITAGALTVSYSVSETGDMVASDEEGAKTVAFADGDTERTVTVPTEADTDHEADSTVTLTLTADAAWDLGTASAEVTVEDDDDSPATGSVTVTGTATEGEALTADTSGLTDADGLANAAYAYQWIRTPSGGSDEDISGATSQTYVPVFADAGATLKVKVTVTDDEGHEATITSAATSAVAALPRPEVTVASDGDVTEGDTVTFTLTRTGDTAGKLDVAYAVTASGDFGVTPGAGTATFLANSATVQVSVATTGDSAHEMHGAVTLTLTADTGVDPVYVLGDPADATAAVRDDDNVAPTGVPTIDDTTPVVGQTLTADSSGIADADGLTGATFTWRWLRVASGGGETEVGTGATYVVVAGDVDTTLKVEASFTDDGGTEETVESAVTSAVEAAPRPRVSVARVSSPVAEGADAQFRVTRTGVTAGALTVAYSVSESGAMVASGDEGAKTVAFADGDTEQTVTVPTEADTDHEADSTVTLTLTADAAWDLGTASADVTVEDDDDSPATGSVTVTGTPTEGETLTADTSGLADADGLDNAAYVYQWVRTPSGGSDADISGATSQTYVPVYADAGATLKVRVTVTDDEGHEATFTSAPTSAVAAAQRPSVTVASAGDVTEGSPALFTLTRTGATAQTLDVAYEVTATGDFGVTTGTGTATFPASSATVQVSVATTGDGAHEAHGSVTVTLTADTDADPAYLLGAPSTATAAVRDDDDSPATGSVTVTGTATEGETLTADTSGLTDEDGLNNAAYAYQWVRTPSGGSDADISGATGATYVPVFADAGATLKVKVTVTDDEGHQATFTSASTSAVAALPRPEVTVASDGDVTEGSAAVFTLTRTGATAGTLDVDYEVTATGAFGVTPGAGTATFPANSATVQVSVATTGDTTDEADGSVTLTLQANPVAYALGTDDTATVTVEDDDEAPLPTVTVAPRKSPVTEGDPAAEFVVTRTGDTTGALRVRLSVSETGDMVSAGNEGGQTRTLPVGQPSVVISVPTVDDGVHEADSVVTVTLEANAAYELGSDATAEVTVEDDDNAAPTGAPTIDDTTPVVGETLTADASNLDDPDGLTNRSFTWRWVRVSGGTDTPLAGATTASYTVVAGDVGSTLKVEASFTDDDGTAETVESAETATVEALPEVTVASDGDVTEGSAAVFTLTRTGDLAQTLDVDYEVTASGDFGVTTGAGTATFLANSATVQVSVATTGDTTHEAHGSVTLTLQARPAAYALGTDDAATAAVEDDDDSPATGAVTVTGTPTEGETLSADTSGLADADGLDSAAYVYQWVRTPSGGSDTDISGATGATYVPVFADVGATLKVRVTVTDDEGHRATFTSASTSAVAVLPRPSVTVVSDGDVTEGSAAVFTLTRTGATAQTLDVAYDVTTSGNFGVTTGASTATFLANNDTVQVSVATTGDSAHETHGSVTVTLTADTGTDPAYVLGDPSTATAAVQDDDDSPATGSVAVTGTATEGETLTADTSGIADEDGLDNAGPYTYQWVRTPSGGSDEDISGATSQTYVPVFADAGATLKVRVTVTDDEGHQAIFTSAPTSAVTAASRPSVTVASAGDVMEGSPAVFTLTRTGATAQTLDVAYETTASGDFGVTPGAGTATFLANSATVQVSVATTGDGAHEAHGSVTVTLTADTGTDPAYVLGDPSTATAAVQDDDDSPATGSVAVTGTATEGETLTADTSGIADADGLANAAYTYQWVRTPSGGSDADISGATSQTYVPVFADAGATLKVRVTVTDDEGHQATFTSASTAAVAALPRPSVTVASDGDVTEGSPALFTLTRTGDTAQTLDVAWEVTATGNFGVTTGADTATFPANSATVQVSVATTGDGTHEAHGSVTLTLQANPIAYALGADAAATAAVRDDDNAAPTGAVTIDDTTPVVGETLTADASGIDDPDGLTNRSFTWQWLRVSGGTETPISGATAASYTVADADVGGDAEGSRRLHRRRQHHRDRGERRDGGGSG